MNTIIEQIYIGGGAVEFSKENPEIMLKRPKKSIKCFYIDRQKHDNSFKVGNVG
jgi:hypothetical protein